MWWVVFCETMVHGEDMELHVHSLHHVTQNIPQIIRMWLPLESLIVGDYSHTGGKHFEGADTQHIPWGAYLHCLEYSILLAENKFICMHSTVDKS